VSERPHLVLVGGFLGAGKTSLILAAARILNHRGFPTAAILNDQGESLVDTGHALEEGLTADEVTGGCFCCRYFDLIDALKRVETAGAHVIFAEPVGSCTDLAATVIRPLLQDTDYRVAPFTVLVDPDRVPAGAAQQFLYGHQLAEADIVCWTKSDLHPGDGRPGRRLSALSGQGVEAWLDEVLSGGLRAGGRVIEVDYEQYAAAEASLVWLNCEARVECDPPLSPAMLAGPLFDAVDTALSDAGAGIVHMKLLDRTSQGFIKAAICGNREEPVVEGDLDASPAQMHELRLNLRAAGDPSLIEEAVKLRLPATTSNVKIDCFRPARPVPQRRG
jgi:Ni2+-binding GTPase involved in maturation of urease and hydrogenase